MPADERVGEEYAAKEASRGNFIPLIVLIALFLIGFFTHRHFIKKYAIGTRYNQKTMLVTDACGVLVIMRKMSPISNVTNIGININD